MSYVLRYTNNEKPAIELSEEDIDQTSSDLALLGRRRLNWGNLLNENLLHILENFSVPEDPSNPGNPDLSLCIDDILSNPSEGQLWFNVSQESLFFWDGDIWVPLGMFGDIAANWGVIDSGQYLPLPVSSTGRTFGYDECSWIVGPFNYVGVVDGMGCTTNSNGLVTATYSVDGVSMPMRANYLIVAIRDNVSGAVPTPTPTPQITLTPLPSGEIGVTPTPTPGIIYATFNPSESSPALGITNGNLTVKHEVINHSANLARTNVHKQMGVGDGKWYMEFYIANHNDTYDALINIGMAPSYVGVLFPVYTGEGRSFRGDGKVLQGSEIINFTSTTITSGTVVGLAVDMSATMGAAWISIDGEYLEGGNPVTGANPTLTKLSSGVLYSPAVSFGGNIFSQDFGTYLDTIITANFGQNAMVYDAPYGYNTGWALI